MREGNASAAPKSKERIFCMTGPPSNRRSSFLCLTHRSCWITLCPADGRLPPATTYSVPWFLRLHPTSRKRVLQQALWVGFL